jgi:hypothetical protein
MAVSDSVVAYSNNLANDGYLAIQPSGTVEWVIHNIYCGGAFEIYWYDGTNEMLILAGTVYGWVSGIFSHCTNTKYLRVKNKSGGAQDFGYDGVITHA